MTASDMIRHQIQHPFFEVMENGLKAESKEKGL